ncbi:MAG: polymer-forming cytoskeletal protein [candidate division Zixibacteria bacterium]|nr:polymer-forming cytoskeletal protein [candidate division Zixibacteria bacterium]MCI0596402.1 polymer-forming cytoskeletal protein [candidate division Zixibacteria bacterium]
MRGKLAVFLSFAAIFVFSAPASATRLAGGEHFSLKSDSLLDDDLILAVKEASISGRITGDLLFAGSGLSLAGPVEGNVWAAGQHVALKGPVQGSVRAFCSDLTIENGVGRNLLAFCGTARLPEGAVVGKDVHIFSGNLMVGGKINGRLNFYGGELVIAGTIGKGAKIQADKITLTSTARIEGDFTYTSKKEAKVEEGAVITGQTTHNLPKKKDGKPLSGWSVFWWLVWRTSELLTGFLLIALFQKQMTAIKGTVSDSFLKALGIGLLSFVVIPVLALLFAVIIIGLPLTLVLTAFYLVALVLACNFTGLPLGEGILRLFKKEGPLSLYASMTVGVLVIQLLEEVPYFGMLVLLATAWIGLGAVILGSYRLSRQLPGQGSA